VRDSSEAALAVAARNAAANGVVVGTQRGDAFEVLDELVRRGERYDAIVLDPPAFIKRKKTFRAARRPIASSTRSRCGCWSATRCW